jgi:delta-aminolevulinic acid dehydratase/porphobilinogen synthase
VGVLTDVALDPYTAHGHDGVTARTAASSTTRR